MSSNFTVKRICEDCQGIFNAKTTVTRFCSRLCNRRSYKLKERNDFMKDVDQQVVNIIAKPVMQLQIREFLSVGQAAKLLGVNDKFIVVEVVGSPNVRIKDCYHMAQAQLKFNISEAGLYNLIKRHKLAKFKKGWFTYVSKSDLDHIFFYT